jgi:hypothetical protein
MAEPILVSKLLDITPSTLIKTSSSTLKGLLVIGAIAGLGWAVYAGVIRPVTKPNPTTTYKAENLYKYDYNYSRPETAIFLGIDLWGWKIGIYKDRQVKQPTESITSNKVK